MEILSGKAIKDQILAQLKEDVVKIKEESKKAPALGLVRIGDRPEDLSYRKGILSSAEKIDLAIKEENLALEASQEDLLASIGKLNQDPEVGGILVFRPLPKGFDEEAVNQAIDPAKDVDCATPQAQVQLFKGDMGGHKPATAISALRMIKRSGIPLSGANILIINRSLVIGKPLAMMLLAENATVTLAHSKSKDLPGLCKKADIVVTAMGQAKMIDASYVREETVLIDCGLSLDKEGKLSGDVDYASVEDKVRAITPVPGGVGALTNTCLLESCLKYFKN
ncbi:MAG: bifunctional 5,10-methylenetetrahydrofolate dehydrogenase/5,10-methenyltetrahydrofolate cyclohydrolase [Tissierellia bacterium]|nr:bifunctional 5,10-methylenetetrahydrofolate dehydrogenase/5,10-methenyltetrahydrofolate cyclohydrolase [Tissierellia bacterium]